MEQLDANVDIVKRGIFVLVTDAIEKDKHINYLTWLSMSQTVIIVIILLFK